VLLVQHDGFVLNPDSWEDEFLQYDYIGAPWLVADWSVTRFNFPEKLLGTQVVGNGGFSLRSKKFLNASTRLAQEGIIKKFDPEDVALCVWHKDAMEAAGARFAPPKIAARFSFEGHDDPYAKQFGFHSLQWGTDISQWIKENPEWDVEMLPRSSK